MTLLISSILGILLAYSWEIFCTKILKKTSLIIFGYRLHHSIYGLLFLVIGIISINIVCDGLGVGIIIQHTITDGFRFISKEAK